MRVAQFGARTESFGKAGFYVHHYFHAFLGSSLIEAGQLIHLLHVSAESIADSGSGRVGSQIIVTFAHTQTALVSLYGILVTVHLISGNIHSEVSADALLAQVSQQDIDVLFVFQSGNLLQIGFDRGNTFLIQLHTVHSNLVEVAHFLSHTTGFVLGSGKFLNQTLYLLAVVLGKFGERAVL